MNYDSLRFKIVDLSTDMDMFMETNQPIPASEVLAFMELRKSLAAFHEKVQK